MPALGVVVAVVEHRGESPRLVVVLALPEREPPATHGGGAVARVFAPAVASWRLGTGAGGRE